MDPRDQIRALPAAPGVYRFRDAHRVCYLGRSSDLRHRVASYWGGLSDRPHLRRMIPQIQAVEAIECDSVHEAAWLERNLLERAKPRWNRIRGGLEVPTYIVLRHQRGGATLLVVHQPAAPDEAFGPYLGGNRSRLAVGALNRALGLSYAGERRSGSERDLARALGVVDDLPGLTELARATLTCEPTAVAQVTAALARRRDEAAAALAFEVAARIEAEREALAWVVSPQRVTGDGPDQDVYGWAGGPLVHLEVRAGRMCRWRQLPAGGDAAHRAAASPPQWAAFAHRAARLAALLS